MFSNFLRTLISDVFFFEEGVLMCSSMIRIPGQPNGSDHVSASAITGQRPLRQLNYPSPHFCHVFELGFNCLSIAFRAWQCIYRSQKPHDIRNCDHHTFSKQDNVREKVIRYALLYPSVNPAQSYQYRECARGGMWYPRLKEATLIHASLATNAVPIKLDYRGQENG